MKHCLLFFSFLLLFFGAQAQYNVAQNRVWAFGDSASISFASGSPVAAPSSVWAGEGCASICDAAGNLLFYTEGTNIYNAAHAIMPHGANVGVPYTATYSSTQGAAIVPKPGASGVYYVFSLGVPPSGSDGNCRLVYSVVDMSLDGGLGDVSGGVVPLRVDDSLSEKMVTVQGNDCDVWLITHRRSMGQILVYRITPTGITGPSTYSFGGYRGQLAYYLGVMKVSHDRHRLVSQSQRMSTFAPGRTELYDFDPSTGVVSNRQIVDTGDMYDPYGAEFSEDNSKLYSFLSMYTPTSSFSRIWQYDLAMPTLADISASRTTVNTYTDLDRRDMKLGPDNKIYVCSPATGFLDCIPYPNLIGATCGYIPNALSLGMGRCYSGLPNTVQLPPTHYDIDTQQIQLCRPAAGFITLTPGVTGTAYAWHDGSTAATHNVTTSGTYWVQAFNMCDVHVDTFHVMLDTTGSVFIGNDTTINAGDVIVLRATPAGAGYVWNNGETGDTIHVGTAGTYWVTTSGELCVGMDTIVVSVTTGVRGADAGVGVGVSPNPAREWMMVSADGLYGERATVSVMDVRGVRVLSENVVVRNGAFMRRINTGELPAGVYVVRIEDDAGYNAVRKLVVQR